MAKAKLTADDYKKYGTVKQDGEDKYPVKNKKTARSALKLINNAKKPLSSSQRSTIRREAAKFGVKPKPGSAADTNSDKKGKKP